MGGALPEGTGATGGGREVGRENAPHGTGVAGNGVSGAVAGRFWSAPADVSRSFATAGGLVAALATGLAMVLMRATLLVRSMPERLLE